MFIGILHGFDLAYRLERIGLNSASLPEHRLADKSRVKNPRLQGINLTKVVIMEPCRNTGVQ